MRDFEWIKLIPFGQYKHQKGLQVVDRCSVETMVNYFKSLRGRFMRKFLGLPIYIGHPDDPEYNGSHAREVYGRVENMKTKGDALWILPRWTDVGRKIFKGGFLNFLSPRWMMKKLSDGIFQPVHLLSIGLTNHPNLRCEHSVENCGNDEREKCVEFFDSEKITNKVFENFEKNKTNYVPEKDRQIIDVDQKNDENIGGKISEPKCENLHIHSLTSNLHGRVNELSCKDKILGLVFEHMSKFGDDYQSAWMTIKHQHPGLFR